MPKFSLFPAVSQDTVVTLTSTTGLSGATSVLSSEDNKGSDCVVAELSTTAKTAQGSIDDQRSQLPQGSREQRQSQHLETVAADIRFSDASTLAEILSPVRDDDASLYALPSPMSDATTVFGSRTSTAPSMSRKKAPPSSIAVSEPKEMRSMFPTYDPDRSLDEQFYLPSQMSPRHIPYSAVCKTPYSPDFDHDAADIDEAGKGGLVFKAVQGPHDGFSREIELQDLWRVDHGDKERLPRQTYRLRMHRAAATPPVQSRWGKKKVIKKVEPKEILCFGPSIESPILSVDHWGSKMTLWRHSLSRFATQPGTSILMSHCKLEHFEEHQAAESSTDSTPPNTIPSDGSELIMTITPRAALLDALAEEGISALAVSPPSSPYNSEKKCSNRHTCDLVFSFLPESRERAYILHHPRLGLLKVKTHGDVRLQDEQLELNSSGEALKTLAGRIELLAPINEKYLQGFGVPSTKPPEIVLVSLNLSDSTLFLDGGALADINEPYIVDTALTALIGVLLAETNVPRQSQAMSFAPPPMHAVTDYVKRKESRFLPPALRSRKPKLKKQSKREKAGAEMEMTLSTAFGALAVVLGVAVDGLAALVEKKQDVQGHGQAPFDSAYQQ